VKTVVDLLVDIVSRNGNLMLNFPLPASGMLDQDELNILEGITKWMTINSEGIYGTRPWKIFGAGPLTDVAKNEKEVNSASQFNENKRKTFSHEDIRFTTKGKTLYAYFMGWPENGISNINIKSLAAVGAVVSGKIELVELLGHGKLNFTRESNGLQIQIPTQKPCEHAFCLKITGDDLT
jgi:alpha-L-fucosidase